MGLVPSVVVLGIAMLAAFQLARSRTVTPDVDSRRAVSRALMVAVALQGAHFLEEAATGFESAFPGLLGLPPMPQWIFVAFNVAWLVVWTAAVPGVANGRFGAYFAAWFLAVAGCMNGIAHPVMAVATTGYFPGLVTSPLVGLASLWLWRRLQLASGRQ